VPLLDHFHPPLSIESSWESFHANWATKLADSLSGLVPPEYRVEEHVHLGPSVEIDVATFERSSSARPSSPGRTPTLSAAPRYAPPVPSHSVPGAFVDTFEVLLFRTRAGKTLVAAVELVSPSSKDRARERRAFAIKCASYLAQGVSLVIVDVVTNRRANLHNETVRLLEVATDVAFPPDVRLYAVAYRPVRRKKRDQIDLWTHRLALGAPLPTLPLRLTGDLFVPVDLESTYQEACRRRRLA
jgi:hypothetical protein